MGDIKTVCVEPHRYVKFEPGGDGGGIRRRGGEGDKAGGDINRPTGILRGSTESNDHRTSHRLGNGPGPALRAGGIGFHQLKRRGCPVASPDRLIA